MAAGDKAFIYWDNSNIFINARNTADAREGAAARKRLRIHFKAMLRLACAGRRMEKAVVAGSVPPESRALWGRLREGGLKVEELFDRGDHSGKEQEVPDERLQLQMMADTLQNSPGVAVLMTGDGKGREKGRGFHFALELMRRKGWRVELMAWERGCHSQMREWTMKKRGVCPAGRALHGGDLFDRPARRFVGVFAAQSGTAGLVAPPDGGLTRFSPG